LRSPVTGEQLAHTRLLTNRALKYMIRNAQYDRLGPMPINLGFLPQAW